MPIVFAHPPRSPTEHTYMNARDTRMSKPRRVRISRVLFENHGKHRRDVNTYACGPARMDVPHDGGRRAAHAVATKVNVRGLPVGNGKDQQDF